jgi:hypothetical protein
MASKLQDDEEEELKLDLEHRLTEIKIKKEITCNL